MKRIIICLILGLVLCGCENETEIEKLMRENEYVIIDVRTNQEYSINHVVDAINIPYDELEDANIDKNKLIFVYCQSGSRSLIAYKTLTELGYNVYDLGAFNKIDLPKVQMNR